jgi:hypothetical protein
VLHAGGAPQRTRLACISQGVFPLPFPTGRLAVLLQNVACSHVLRVCVRLLPDEPYAAAAAASVGTLLLAQQCGAADDVTCVMCDV